MATSKEYPLSIIIKTVDKATAGLRSIGKTMDGVAKRADKIGKSMVKVGKKMTTNLTLPIIGLGAASVKAFSNFESGMTNVSTLVDTSTESMADMGRQVQAIGNRVPVSLGNLTSALFDIRSAGIPAAEAMKVLERSAKLGVAGLGTTEQAARLAAGAINAWGLEGEEADRIYNTIFQTTKNGITTIAGLEQGFGAVAGKMAKAGIEADDYLASVAALTTTTLKASEAHTQMKAAVDGLEKSGKKTKKIFKRLGVKDFKELIKTSGGVTEAFRLVAKAAGNQSGALKDLIGSSEGAAAVTALVGQQGDKQLKTLVDMRKETVGLTDDQIAFNKQNATSASQWQRTKNSLSSAAMTIGAVLVPVLTKVATKIQSVAKWFGGLDDSTKKTIIKIAAVTAVVGPMVIALGKVAPGVGLIITALKLLAVVALAHPMFALAAAIAAVAAFSQQDFMSETDKKFVEDLGKDPTSRINRRKRQAELDAKNEAADLQEELSFELGAPRAPEPRSTTPWLPASAWGIQPPSSGFGGLGPDIKGKSLGGSADAAQQAIQKSAQVTVSFKNAPEGTRVETTKSSGVDVSTETGYQMGGS